MAAPATRVYPSFLKSAGESGAVREYWVKMTGLTGSAAADVGVANVVANPFPEDMVIYEAFIYVTTASGDVAVDYDIGLGDSAAGASNGAELADGMVAATLNTVGIKDLGIVHAIATPPVKPIWKAPLTATTADSWLVFDQNGAVEAGTLVFNCYVKVIPVADLA